MLVAYQTEISTTLLVFLLTSLVSDLHVGPGKGILPPLSDGKGGDRGGGGWKCWEERIS